MITNIFTTSSCGSLDSSSGLPKTYTIIPSQVRDNIEKQEFETSDRFGTESWQESTRITRPGGGSSCVEDRVDAPSNFPAISRPSKTQPKPSLWRSRFGALAILLANSTCRFMIPGKFNFCELNRTISPSFDIGNPPCHLPDVTFRGLGH